ncbi:methyltransferase type 11 [Candidatus Moduliflexus flocculans]|uniref:Methyltransferase type 11 n=1 Tax=Candidatus Moduliflexus flocculans TaxID=1499966 RepID=A0A081BP05_9BACT|nr:methyltransferase type 11 [Candidatus Moduliflexus flocculans]
MIQPREVIAKLGVDGLCESAERYFQQVIDPTPLMAKPFMNLMEAPGMLYHLGLLLAGLKLAKTMTVLEFGAGTCWLSRLLTQLQCAAIAVDPSPTALRIGQKLFREYPVIGAQIAEPQFLHFDGRRIPLPDESVDRIVCFDAFHHVPNPQEVLAEFARILKPGGMAGFSEPGRHHSRSPQSQAEMQNYDVLECDLKFEELAELAHAAGFSDCSCKLLCDPERDLSLSDYQKLVRSKFTPPVSLSVKLWQSLYSAMQNAAIFFFYKGTCRLDSRGHLGLSHTLRTRAEHLFVSSGEPLRIPITIVNTGTAHWLNQNIADIGVVKLGAHLYDDAGKLLNLDFWRMRLEHPVSPETEIELTAEIVFPEPGIYQLAFDLVSEQVCWFEHIGSAPIRISVTVNSANAA